MKRFFILTLLAFAAVLASAQTKKVSVLGDSYSTFKDYNPEGYAPFYPDAHNDVKEVGQTWWSLYIEAKGYQLEKNNSWGGTTICGTGYFHRDVFNSYFISRVDTSIPTGRKTIARVSVPPLPACWICCRDDIRKRRSTPS